LPAPKPGWRRPWAIATAGAVSLGVIGLAAWLLSSGTASARDEGFDPRRVAVLYLQDQTNGRLGYLADGLTETLIDELRRVDALNVLSKDAVSGFRNANVDSVIRGLEPGTIVRGSLSEDGRGVRISVNVWDGNGVERGNGLAFTVADSNELALRQAFVDSVGPFLREFVGTEIRARRLESGTTNQRAWTLVQRAEKDRKNGVTSAARGDTAGAKLLFASADSLLQEAEALDDKWVTPVALRASLALHARSIRTPVQAEPFIDKGLEHAERALALDANDLDATEARGRLRKARWDLQLDSRAASDRLLEGAREDLKSVTDRDQTRALALVALSSVYAQLKEPTLALLAADKALTADAYFTGADVVLLQLFGATYDAEDFAQAKRRCDEGRRRFPNNWRFVSCQILLHASGRVARVSADSAWKALATLDALAPANERAFLSRRHQMFVASILAQNNLADSARRVMLSARAGRDVDPTGRLLTAEALNRPSLGTADDTVEAYKLLQQYVLTQPQHGAGFADSRHWWWRGLKADQSRWNQYLGGR
jgi:TolB-like protein